MGPTVGIIFGGRSFEHDESVSAAQKLYKYSIKRRLDSKYNFRYFYLTQENLWSDSKESKLIIRRKQKKSKRGSKLPPAELKEVNLLYSTMMGTSGENGNIMGLADLMNIGMIGCDILSSSLTLDKYLTKRLVQAEGIPIVDYLYADRSSEVSHLVKLIKQKIGFPCFVKPTNLGTCYFVFKANNEEEFVIKWKEAVKHNEFSQKYLIEKFIPNIEVRVFLFENLQGKLFTNDLYVTKLKEEILDTGGVLFNHLENSLDETTRAKIQDQAKKIFYLLQMRDYGRVDFFVAKGGKVYFNEANTQPFISKYNIDLLQKSHKIDYPMFLDTMIQRGLKRQ